MNPVARFLLCLWMTGLVFCVAGALFHAFLPLSSAVALAGTVWIGVAGKLALKFHRRPGRA
jgi:hypothetical protein